LRIADIIAPDGQSGVNIHTTAVSAARTISQLVETDPFAGPKNPYRAQPRHPYGCSENLNHDMERAALKRHTVTLLLRIASGVIIPAIPDGMPHVACTKVKMLFFVRKASASTKKFMNSRVFHCVFKE